MRKGTHSQVADQTPLTIVDCAARTITTLDLRKKTIAWCLMEYAVGSKNSNAGSGAPGPRSTDDGTKIAIVISNNALGSREFGGQPTSGFSSDMSFTGPKPSGESQSYNGSLVIYYSSYANPASSCARFGATSPNGQSRSNGAQALSTMAGGYARFTHALGGPEWTRASASSNRAVRRSRAESSRCTKPRRSAAVHAVERTFVFERGNLRPISANDPIFRRSQRLHARTTT